MKVNVKHSLLAVAVAAALAARRLTPPTAISRKVTALRAAVWPARV